MPSLYPWRPRAVLIRSYYKGSSDPFTFFAGTFFALDAFLGVVDAFLIGVFFAGAFLEGAEAFAAGFAATFAVVGFFAGAVVAVLAFAGFAAGFAAVLEVGLFFIVR